MNSPPATTHSYHLICGIICGSAPQIAPLLQDINKLSRYKFLKKISLYLLANGESRVVIAGYIAKNCPDILKENIHILENHKNARLQISKARNLLQQSVGRAMLSDETAIVWLIDDDMRIPEIAETYLKWLPIIKQKNIDAVIGCITGGSPNPAAHGIRVQINDLLYNLNWLATLHDNDLLPDKSQQNAAFRLRYPDYYYDLSRKHSEHLSKPYWVMANHPNATVAGTRQFMLDNLDKIFTNEPFLRLLIINVPQDPLENMRPSCNRGSNCFIFNPKTLTQTPNISTSGNGSENRRSDMIWALINRYYHGFNIVAVDFPLHHHRFIATNTNYDLSKNIAEIKGAALYASLCDFFERDSNAGWNFTDKDCRYIIAKYQEHISKRLKACQQNYDAIDNMLEQLAEKKFDKYPQLTTFGAKTRNWIQAENLIAIENACKHDKNNLKEFLINLPKEINMTISH